jgi:phospholipase/carboxylesterase
VPTAIEPYTTYERGWIVRIQPPRFDPASADQRTQPRSLLLLHGWTGDETVMWIFTRNLTENYWIFAPRAPVPAPEGGYGWVPREQDWPELAEFQGISDALLDAFRHWASRVHAPRDHFDVMGFSQGAAMAYALAAYHPQPVNRVVALAGFLPPVDSLPGRYSELHGKKVYVAHGTQDETVPVGMAQEAVRTLQSVDAQVTYCESDVGHKLSAGCLRGLEGFLA